MELERVCRVLGVLYRRSLDYMNNFSQTQGITALDTVFLIFLFSNEGMNQERLSTRLAIDKSATAKAMKSLEAAGLITRTRSSQDKRAKVVRTTEKGRALRPFIERSMRTYMDDIAGGVSPEDLDTTLRTLETVTDRLVGTRGSGPAPAVASAMSKDRRRQGRNPKA